MIRQYFDADSFTYTYLVVDEKTKKAVIIDPVKGQLSLYLKQIESLNVTLVAALDTHVHADHITALGDIKTVLGVPCYVGAEGEVPCADASLEKMASITVGQTLMEVIYTPGHTQSSFTFYWIEKALGYLFTGDTLLIGGTGRTDFQEGDANALFDSLHEKLLRYSDDTVVYPGHDYHGLTASTIGEEKQTNPRLQISDRQAFAAYMASLDLPEPKHMDIAVPANRMCGQLLKGGEPRV